MQILGIESSARAAGAAVLRDGTVLSEAYLNAGLTHSQTLLTLVDHCLRQADLRLSDLDAFAVAKGPGSFTGIRIGVSAVKGFCFPASKPVYGVSTLEAMAYGAAVPGYLVCPVMDARCGQVYTAGFLAAAEGLRRVFDDAPMKLEELLALLQTQEKTPLLVGDGADLTAAFLQEHGADFAVFPEIYKFQHASAVAFAAYKRYNNGDPGEDAEKLVPSYLRLSQAERERKKKESQL